MKKISSVSRFTAPLLALTLVLAACAVPAKRYLAVAPSEPVDDNNPAMAVVLLHPFTEDFATDGQLGLHRLHGNRQTKL
ncbi:MAG: hypothetical protein OEL80_07470, partial [Desulfuromonadales bacterium]|nr:hypothetical protein [Desulfuromonadales bacterium]